MPASYPAELIAAVFIHSHVFQIFPADHQRAAQVLAKNLHAERGEIAEKCWEHLYIFFLSVLYLKHICVCVCARVCACVCGVCVGVYVRLGDVPGGDRGDPGCD